MWLHVKIGAILAGLEDVKDTVREVSASAKELNFNQGSMRVEISGMVNRLDNTATRVAELEEDVKPLAAITSGLAQCQKDIREIQPVVRSLDRLRWKAMGATIVFSLLAAAIEMVRNLLTVHAAGP